MQRMDVLDNTGKVTSVNAAYAWHDDPAQRKRIVWKKVQFIDETGNLVEKETWVQLDNLEYRWNGTSFIKRIP